MMDPGLRFAQIGLIFFAVVVLFLLFFALRDILLRTRSFWYQFLCIVIVTLFPIIGFLIYLLIRPARTIRERELESMILTLVANDAPNQVLSPLSVPSASQEVDRSEDEDDTVTLSEHQEAGSKHAGHHKKDTPSSPTV